jgi:hypothetical protein
VNKTAQTIGGGDDAFISTFLSETGGGKHVPRAVHPYENKKFHLYRHFANKMKNS